MPYKHGIRKVAEGGSLTVAAEGKVHTNPRRAARRRSLEMRSTLNLLRAALVALNLHRRRAIETWLRRRTH
jgi:hypothetical protein